MARRRYFRSYRRTYPKKKWATNMKNGQLFTTTTSGSANVQDILVYNSSQNASPTPVIVKTGNFKIQGDCYLSVSSGTLPSGSSVTVYVMFLPEVVASSASIVTAIDDHPEWIMAWKLVDLSMSSGTNSSTSVAFSVSSRLKRNLNSGDTIALVAVLRNSTSGVTLRLNYNAQYWTCAN